MELPGNETVTKQTYGITNDILAVARPALSGLADGMVIGVGIFPPCDVVDFIYFASLAGWMYFLIVQFVKNTKEKDK